MSRTTAPTTGRRSLPADPSRPRWRRARWPRLRLLGTALCLAAVSCDSAPPVTMPIGTEPGPGGGGSGMVSEPTGDRLTAFDAAAGGLGAGWEDYGWAAEVPAAGPVRLDLGGWGGWIVANPASTARTADVELRLRLPDGLDPDGLLRVGLGNGSDDLPVIAAELHAEDGWWVATVDGASLNPGGVPIDRIVLQAARELPSPTIVEVAWIGLALRTTPRLVATGTAASTVSADCSAAGGHDISPYIYGVAFAASRESDGDLPWELGPTARRWGGNPTSRYNWQDGHTWNTAADWFWRNVVILGGDTPAWQQFLATNAAHGVASVVTVPTIGWVAKDGSSYSFPVSEYGPQGSTDPDVPDAGDGTTPDGDPIDPGPPSSTSVAAPPSFIGQWVTAMAAQAGAPLMYILDNEPDLWNDTHRDVHPEPVGYDELLERTVEYGSAVRAADPDALIAGPASWGWWGYEYSAVDAAAGFRSSPDRDAHGGQPLLAWYLDQLRAHEARTGVRLLDVLDVHYYPQASGVYDGDGGSGGDLETARRRVRSTRSLWDPTYRDESWIETEVQLLPRMQQLIADHYPGLRLSIGEYGFGGEHSPSGAVAQAEALGRFAQYDVYSAFSWTYPTANSAAGTAFRAFRDFDGQGGRFLDRWVPSTGTEDVSLFSSTDGHDVVAVLVNRSDRTAQSVTAGFAGCGAFDSVTAYQYDGSVNDLRPVPATLTDGAVSVELPPWSVTTIRLSWLSTSKG